jgi:hypothetical protein
MHGHEQTAAVIAAVGASAVSAPAVLGWTTQCSSLYVMGRQGLMQQMCHPTAVASRHSMAALLFLQHSSSGSGSFAALIVQSCQICAVEFLVSSIIQWH